ncbi:MAG: ribokinase [Chloroflexi bacterium]|nr:ribokinase [Chloroflexota bacterium]
MRIVCFGSLNQDVAFDVDRRPDWGETIIARSMAVASGGKGANQAAAAARLGDTPVLMVGRVGRDGAGTSLRGALASSGVSDAIVDDPAVPSGSAFILRGRDGENAIVVAAGANERTALADLEAVAVSDEPAVLVLQLEIPVPVVASAIEMGAGRGWHVLLNAAPVRPGVDPGLLRGVDTLVVNEVEAAQLSGLPVRGVSEAARAARALLPRGPGLVAVTLGARGAVLVSRESAWHADPPDVAVVDTTAAGDAFVGALAVAIAEGLTEERALALAVAAGSLATTRAGAQPSLPARGEARELAASVRVDELVPSSVPAGGLPM